MAEGPIPWTAVKAYADEMNIVDEEQREDFFYYIRTMDAAYVDFRSKELERKK